MRPRLTGKQAQKLPHQGSVTILSDLMMLLRYQRCRSCVKEFLLLSTGNIDAGWAKKANTQAYDYNSDEIAATIALLQQSNRVNI
jgi:hypothetical protein